MTNGKGTTGELRGNATPASSPDPADDKQEIRTPAFICDVCGKSTASKYALKKHKQRAHEEE